MTKDALREPILTALAQARAHHLLYKAWKDHHPDAALPVRGSAPSSYQQWATIRDARITLLHATYRSLRTYLTQQLAAAPVAIVWSHVLEVCMGSATSSSGRVVIELSMYGPLAATYYYGIVPTDVRASIASALQAVHIMELTPAERDALDAHGWYRDVF